MSLMRTDGEAVPVTAIRVSKALHDRLEVLRYELHKKTFGMLLEQLLDDHDELERLKEGQQR